MTRNPKRVIHHHTLTSHALQTLLDDIINTVNVLADRALDSVERLLLSIPPQNLGFTDQPPPKKGKASSSVPPTASPEDAAKLEIETGTHKLETLLTASIDRNFDKLELYAMQNILTVQPRDLRQHMRLGHYAGLDFAALPPANDDDGKEGADTSDRPTVESVTALRRRLQASQKLNVALHREQTRNDALLHNLREVLGVRDVNVKKEETEDNNTVTGEQDQASSTFGFLSQGKTSLTSMGSQTPITTTTQFTLSQLQALRALSTSLRALLPDLQPPPPTSTGDDDDGEEGRSRESSTTGVRKTWRKERAGYVEASSRKYLENSSGLEMGKLGGVRDGEYQGEGRGLSKGEVEGLENAVSMLEKTRQSDTAAVATAKTTTATTDDDAMDES